MLSAAVKNSIIYTIQYLGNEENFTSIRMAPLEKSIMGLLNKNIAT